MDKNFKIPPVPTEKISIKGDEELPKQFQLQDSRTVEELRVDYIEELKKLTKEEGIEVLQNLEINDKNLELSVKMAEIQQEMEKRQIILKADKDTGEVKKGTNEFSKLQKDTLKETKKELTKPSKYIRGAVMAGVIAAGLYIDQAQYGPISQTITNIEALEVTEFCTMLAAAGATLVEIGFAIKQEIKSRVVANQKVQRIIGMIGLGMEKEKALNVVRVETAKDVKASFLLERSAQKSGYNIAGKEDPWAREYSDEEKKLISQTRTTLDEMGIKRISREKNQG